MNKIDLLALMAAIMHATRFDAQGYGKREEIRDDVEIAGKIYDRVVSTSE